MGLATRAEYGVLVVYALIAGSAFLFTKEGTKHVPPLLLVLLRLAIGSSVLGIAFVACTYARRGEFSGRGVFRLRWIFAVGVLNTVVPYSLFAFALNGAGGLHVGVSAVLSALGPVFAAAMKFRRVVPVCGALLFGALGVTLLMMRKIASHSGGGTPLAYTVFLCGVLCKAAGAALGEATLPKRRGLADLLFVSCLQTACGAGVALVLVLCCTPGDLAGLGRTPAASWGAVLYLGLCASCLVYLLQFFLLLGPGAVFQLTVDFLTPVVGLVQGAVWQEELRGLTWVSWVELVAGTLCILGALVLVPRSMTATEPMAQTCSQPGL
mmetsp:Transcript_8215/g.20304  ORF Transcript_8215/g.20304 Transcript_8215/m.20304 type:complete len:324 (+) Transcript_8215:21-992(+)